MAHKKEDFDFLYKSKIYLVIYKIITLVILVGDTRVGKTSF